MRMRRLPEAALTYLFPRGTCRPCPVGTALLETFASKRSKDSAFIEPQDFVETDNSAFFGVAEWDEFSERDGSCRRYRG